MTKILTIDELQAVGREVTGISGMVLSENMTADEIVGWDSLNHTLIIMELSVRCDTEIDAEQAAACRNFGELVAYINGVLRS